MEARREGMLRLEFQDWYPSLQAGKWYPANELTGMVMDHLQRGSPQWSAEGRVPSNDHFVFRGGLAQHGPVRSMRSADRAPRSEEGPGTSAQLDS